MSDWSDDNPDIHDQQRNDEEENGGPDPQNNTYIGQFISTLVSWAFQPSHLMTTTSSQQPYSKVPENSSSSKNDEEERQKRMKEMDDKIAAQKAETEAILAKQKEKKKKEKAEVEQQAIERQLKIKEEDEKQKQFLQQKEQERKMKAKAAEEQHRKKLDEFEEQRLKDIQAMEVELENFEIKQKERKAKAEEDAIKRREQSEASLAEIIQVETDLKNEMEKFKNESEQESKEWEAKLEERLKSVQNEYQKEIENRRRQEKFQIETLKRINEEDEQKFKALTKSLGELQNVVAIKAKEMIDFKTDFEDSKPAVLPQQSIKIVENKLIGSSEIVIQNDENQPGIGVIGLPKSGRSFLIGALAGGIWPRDLGTENPVISKNDTIYKLNHPNNGFINGSVNENRPIYEHFFQTSTLSKLSILILTIDGAVREEDYLVLCLAKQYNIPTVIVRTKLDEWLDNLPSGQTKDEYVQKDKALVVDTLQSLDFDYPKENIYNISALGMITVKEDGAESEMIKYQQDEQKLIERLQQFECKKDVKVAVEKPDLMVFGLKNSGKSAVVSGLQKHGYFANGKIKELSYDEINSFEEVIRMLENFDAKLYLIVVPNTVGNLDAKISSYLFDAQKNVIILLSKSDEQIDNLKKQGTFASMEEYIKQRHDAANVDLEKVNAINIPKFTVSAIRLDGTLDESYSTEEHKFLEHLKQFV